ncbi:hypothetical protein NIES4101_36230 [Calothrix sp. NIES-4101]|nr:hypothetical protein NIES4101_36230 [Calothrix sp. NIES-4101]
MAATNPTEYRNYPIARQISSKYGQLGAWDAVILP